MEIFLAPLSMVYTFRNLFVLRECVLTFMTSTTETFLTSKLFLTRLWAFALFHQSM